MALKISLRVPEATIRIKAFLLCSVQSSKFVYHYFGLIITRQQKFKYVLGTRNQTTKVTSDYKIWYPTIKLIRSVK